MRCRESCPQKCIRCARRTLGEAGAASICLSPMCAAGADAPPLPTTPRKRSSAEDDGKFPLPEDFRKRGRKVANSSKSHSFATTTAAMRIACFGTKPYDRESFEKFNAEGKFGHQITYFEARLTEQTVRY